MKLLPTSWLPDMLYKNAESKTGSLVLQHKRAHKAVIFLLVRVREFVGCTAGKDKTAHNYI